MQYCSVETCIWLLLNETMVFADVFQAFLKGFVHLPIRMWISCGISASTTTTTRTLSEIKRRSPAAGIQTKRLNSPDRALLNILVGVFRRRKRDKVVVVSSCHWIFPLDVVPLIRTESAEVCRRDRATGAGNWEAGNEGALSPSRTTHLRLPA